MTEVCLSRINLIVRSFLPAKSNNPMASRKEAFSPKGKEPKKCDERPPHPCGLWRRSVFRPSQEEKKGLEGPRVARASARGPNHVHEAGLVALVSHAQQPHDWSSAHPQPHPIMLLESMSFRLRVMLVSVIEQSSGFLNITQTVCSSMRGGIWVEANRGKVLLRGKAGRVLIFATPSITRKSDVRSCMMTPYNTRNQVQDGDKRVGKRFFSAEEHIDRCEMTTERRDNGTKQTTSGELSVPDSCTN